MLSRLKPIGLAAVAALALAGCEQGADKSAGNATGKTGPIAAPAGQDWTTTVSQTPEGGFLMGNPDAPVKLVEYVSLTCSHCAEFARQAFVPLRDQYVKKGTVSFELRNYVRDPVDVAASLVTRCNGAEPYFQMTEQLLAAQGDILEKASAMSQAEYQRLGTMQPAEQFAEVARATGIDQFARQRGIGDEKLQQCLSDKAALDKLVEMQQVANNEIKIQGTPTFLINGKIVENAGTWTLLEPKLREAGA